MNLDNFTVEDRDMIVYFSDVTGEQFIITKSKYEPWSVFVSYIDDDGECVDGVTFAASSLSSAIRIIEERENGLIEESENG